LSKHSLCRKDEQRTGEEKKICENGIPKKRRTGKIATSF
jgi:hypothetical protein